MADTRFLKVGYVVLSAIWCLVGMGLPVPFVLAADESIVGTYRMVSATRKVLDTGDVFDSFGKDPKGSIMYGSDGRFLVLVTNGGRHRAESIDKITGEQAGQLFRTMLAYGGTYVFDGKQVEPRIDISWNEVWTGIAVIRDVQRDGEKLIYTTRPGPFALDGKISVNTLVWEKVK